MKILKNVSLYGKITDIAVENGKISAIGKLSGEGVDFGGARIFPGLIDTHSHGCIGLDTMEGGLEEMADFQLSRGVTTWYPTTMTMSEEDIIAATHRDINFGHGANIPGFHMEYRQHRSGKDYFCYRNQWKKHHHQSDRPHPGRRRPAPPCRDRGD